MAGTPIAVDRSTTPSGLVFPDRFNLAAAMVDRHLDEGREDKTAFVADGGRSLTYGALAAETNRAGNALRDVGLRPGDRLVMVVKDCPDFVTLFYGAIKSGVVPVPVNTLLRTADYRHMIEDSGCAAVVYSPEYAAEVEPALAAARPGLRVALALEGDGGFAALRDSASAALDAVPSTAGGECFWLYSSGSTGRPKGAVHRQRDIPVNAEHYAARAIGLGEDDICFSAAKLFFAYGLGNSMNFPLWVGAQAVLCDRAPSPDMTFEVIETHRPSVYFGVPTLYAAQLRALDSADRDLSPLRMCVSAGEALPPDIFRRWRERTGLAILDGIGSTEATHIFISNTPEAHRPGSSGRVVPGYRARVVDESGAAAAAGEPGRLMIEGESFAARYWNQPEKTAATMKGSWLDTGDTYIRDAEGWFSFCGRSDDMIKVGGIWCSPIEIEARLIEHPQVLEAGVVGRADEDGLVKPEAFVILNDPSEAGDALAGALIEHCKSGLARYKYPRWIAFVDDLPKTATGKIQRFLLRRQAP